MTDRIRAVALTGNSVAPGARFRVEQLVPAMARAGVDVDLRMARISSYPPRRRWLRPAWFPATLAARIPDIAATYRGDVTLFQREFLSTFTTLEFATARPRVLDVDDAIWLHPQRGDFARRLAGKMDVIIAGNTFLAAWFGQYCPRVEVLPTSVDTSRFAPAASGRIAGPPAVGWIGTAANYPYLVMWQDALAIAMAAEPELRLRVCADLPPPLGRLPAGRVDWVPWSPEAEVPFVQSIDVGIMPLKDSPWARGKCAYKMLLYLSCGVPAVVSPVGMNAEVLMQAQVGHGASNTGEVAAAIMKLVRDQEGRQAKGLAGRALVERLYSVEAIAPRLAGILRNAARLHQSLL